MIYVCYYVGLLGILQYGVHMNGYVRTEAGGFKLWIARRSETKATYPGMLDNMVRTYSMYFTCLSLLSASEPHPELNDLQVSA